MDSKLELALVGVISPVCLMKCKSCLSSMHAGEAMDVLVQYPEVVEELERIIERSVDEVADCSKEGDTYRICIRKG